MLDRNACRLRPMEASDLDLVLHWRNRDKVRQAMYTDHVISREEHHAWFDRVSREKKTRHLIFEYAAVPIGVVNVVDINTAANRCTWGFYVGAESAPRGVGSTLGFCALEYLFETCGFRKVIGEALATNEASIRFHRRLGFVEEGRLIEHVGRSGGFIDVITFAIFDRDWSRLKSSLAARFFGEEAGE